MATKEFIIDKRGYALIGDERDVMIPVTKYDEVVRWCGENGVDATTDRTSHAALVFKVNLWRVKDERQRLVFMLRWS